MNYTAFVIMPFSNDFDWLFEELRKLTDDISTVGENTISLTRASEKTLKDRVLDNVIAMIDQADIVIVDITGQNNNVIFEFGYAKALGKTIIPICDAATDFSKLATDYASYTYTPYDKQNLPIFSAKFRQRIRDSLEMLAIREQQETASDQDEILVTCYKDRKVADLSDKISCAKREIKILQTNMDTLRDDYIDALTTVIENNEKLSVQLLTLDPESHFAAGRATQLGKDVYTFRFELHQALQDVYRAIGNYRNVEIRTYDDFPTQIMFQIDDAIYNSVVSKYQPARNNCTFEVNARLNTFQKSFSLHFTSVWRDSNTTSIYLPKEDRFKS